jgi:imidazolonepropionase
MHVDILLINCNVATMLQGYGISRDAIVAIKDGKIHWVGPSSGSPLFNSVDVYDCKGAWVTPGLIDCHTHIVYGGNRAKEWELKLAGASYEEVALAGGGIVSTVGATRDASVGDLVASASPRVEALLAEGVTAMEIKSGYGLNLEAERNQLLAAREIATKYGITVGTTFLGAHALPKEYDGKPDLYISEVIRMLRVLNQQGLVDCVDAFCESIGFSVEQTSRVFEAAKQLGLPVRLHGDQLHDFSGGLLARKHQALSVDHCEHMGKEGVAAMAEAGSVAVLLPTANYFIRETLKPPVEAFRQAGVEMAIATNCNPGSSPCCSLLLAMNMACTLFGLTAEEAVAGVTRNAAKAMGLEKTHGTLEIGKVADLALWEVKDMCELPYHLGLNCLKAVFRNGIKI